MIGRLRSLEYKWIVAAIFVFGLFMDLLDTTIVNVALPTLGEEFNTTTSGLEWVVTAYLLSLAVWIPASGWLGDRFGTKRIFMLALFLFTAGSFLCGEAQSLNQLIFFRVLQGVGGGMLTPVGTAMLYRAFPPHERAKASAVLVIPVAIAPTVGPVLGGLLVDGPGWRWIFRVNLPVGIAGLLFAWRFLREHVEPQPGTFDIPGFILSATGLPLLLFGLSEGPTRGWGELEVAGTIIAGLILLMVFVLIETRTETPLLALRLFRERMFRIANTVNFLVMGGMIGVIFLLPLFLQQLMGLSATESGLTTFTQALGMIFMARITSRIYPIVGPRRLVMIGMGLTAILTACFVFVDLETSLWWIRAIMFGRGIAMGFAMIPLQAAMFANIGRRDSGQASALSQTNRQVAGSVGVALLATILAERTASRVADVTASGGNPLDARVGAFHDAYLVGAGLALIGFVAAFFIRDQDAAASMSADAAQPQGH
jgi:EmrB/QacA subfamily drug resistance transporter